MSELKKKVDKAIERLKLFEPDDGYYLAYSGGKDSDVIKILADLANVKYEAVHNLTTVDAPETVQYIKSQKDVRIDKARDKDGKHITMWNLIEKKMIPPTRLSRYCCSALKERGGQGRVVVTGVRWAESPKRKEHSGIITIINKPKSTQKLATELGAEYKTTKQGGIILNDDNDVNRRLVEQCYRTRKSIINPIVDWTDDDVWEFLNYNGCEGNPLYKEEGCSRVGCIGCPMASKKNRLRKFEKYPAYKQNYIRAFDKMLKKRIENGRDVNENWKTGKDVFDWWFDWCF